MSPLPHGPPDSTLENIDLSLCAVLEQLSSAEPATDSPETYMYMTIISGDSIILALV